MNAKLLRAVLTQVEDHPEQFDMSVWGRAHPGCGTTACIAGWALILSGWTIAEHGAFRDPDGRYHVDIECEAVEALGLTEDEYWADGDTECLFTLDDFEAVARLRELTEKAEGVVADV